MIQENWVNRILILIVCLCFVACDKGNLGYGRKSNELRKKLLIPIIENNMIDEKLYKNQQGNKWSTKKQIPSEIGEVIHVWKVVTPLTDTGILYKEADAYRRRISDTNIVQFNIFFEVKGDTIVDRTGTLSFHNKVGVIVELNGTGVDSVCRQWGLWDLIKK